MDFFLRDGDQSRLKNARLADDMDLLYSKRHIGPWGPELVACAMHSGVHVCWYCFEQFSDDPASKLRLVETRLGNVLVALHAKCVGTKPASRRSFDDLVRGHQLRRQATKIVKATDSLSQAAEEGRKGAPLDLSAARDLIEKP